MPQEGPSPAAIRTTLSGDGARALVAACGEFDMANSPDLWQALVGHIEAGRAVTLDLGEVTFLDASTVSALASACATAAERGVSMSITNARHRAVTRIFSVLQADNYLPLE